MKSNVLITQLKENDKHTPEIRRNIPKHIRSSKSIEIKKRNSAFVIKNEKNFNETKKNMIEYLINEETQYIDLFKCRDFYKEISNKHNNLYNINENELMKKKAKINTIDNLIQSEIVSNMNPHNKQIDIYYKNIIEEIKRKIEYEKLDNDNCLDLQNKIIVGINSTKEKIYNLVLLDDKKQVLYDKYNFIKENAQMSYKRQKNLNNDLIDYDNKFNENYDEELKNKKAKFKELEYHVFKIKNTTVTIQKKIEEIRLKTASISENIKLIRKKNLKLNEERKIIRKEYLKTKIQLLQIFQKLKFKSLDEIILQFNTESKGYINHFSSFINLNKEIARMSCIFTDLNDKYMKMKKEISNHVNSSQKEKSDKVFDDPNLLPIIINYKEINESNNYLIKDLLEKEKLLMNFISHLIQNSQRMNKIQENMKAQLNQSSSESARDVVLVMNEIKPQVLSELESLHNWDVYDAKIIIKFWNKFQFNVNYVFYSNLVQLGNALYQRNLDDQSPFLYDLNDYGLNSKIEENISKAMYNLENKYKIMLRSDRELFMEHKTYIVEKKKETLSKYINIKHLFSLFKRTSNEEDIAGVNNSIKPKLVKQLTKFTNYLVIDNEALAKKHLKENSLIKRQNGVKNEDKLKEEKIITDKNDSYKEDEKPPEILIKPNVHLGGKELIKSDLNKLYKRVGEVNKLQLKYLSDKDNNLNNKEFNEIYYKLKKKSENHQIISRKKSNEKNSNSNKNIQKTLSPSIKITGTLDNIIENSRNKGNSVAPQFPSISKGLPSISMAATTFRNERTSKNTIENNIKRSFKKSCETNRIVNDLFDDEYLRENDDEIQKYLKKSSHSIIKIKKPLPNPFYIK